MGFQITAVIILLAFYGCYFGKMLMQRKKGIKTDQIGKGKTGMVKRVELTMKAATLLVPAVEVISIIGNITALPLGIRRIGAGIAAVGDVDFILSVWTMNINDVFQLDIVGSITICNHHVPLADCKCRGRFSTYFLWKGICGISEDGT